MEEKTTRKTKSKSTVVSVTLSQDVCEKIDELAATIGWTRSLWIRLAVKEKLERDEESQKSLFK